MTQVLTQAHIDYVVNGHRHQGFAEEDRPVEFQTGEDLVNIQIGADGATYGSTNAMLGGDVTVRLHPNSPSVIFWLNEKTKWKQAVIAGDPITTYTGSYSDLSNGRQATLSGGTLRQCPDMAEPGQTFEVVVHYAYIGTSVDAVNATPTVPVRPS